MEGGQIPDCVKPVTLHWITLTYLWQHTRAKMHTLQTEPFYEWKWLVDFSSPLASVHHSNFTGWMPKRQCQCSDWVLVWLSAWSEVQIVYMWSSWCYCHPETPSSLASFKSRLVFSFWYWFTQVVMEKTCWTGVVLVMVVVAVSVHLLWTNSFHNIL